MFKKHTLITMALAGVLTMSVSAPAMAASDAEATSGSVKLTNSDVTAFGISPTASESVGGGTWNYGTEIIGNQKHVWSIYDHNDKSHSATVILGSDRKESGWKPKRTTARADLYGNKEYTGYAYWDTYNK